MSRILHVALRDFLATVMTKGFIIGLLIAPAIGGVMILVGPWLFDDSRYQIEGEYAVVDPTGAVLPAMSAALDPGALAERRMNEFRRTLGDAPEAVRGLAEAAIRESMDDALGPAPDVRLRGLPADADVEAAKAWLNEEPDGPRHTALIVVHEHAVTAGAAQGLGSYDLFVPPGLDDRDLAFIHDSVRDAIVDARVAARSLDRDELDALLRVPRPRSTTVSPDAERETVGGLNTMLPMAFMILMFLGVMSGGQTMLTSMIEEKSTRVVEVLLSAVSPMELMAGKLIGGVAITLVMLGLYIAMGLVLLSTFSLFGLLDPWLTRLPRDLLPDRVLPVRVADAGGGRRRQRHDRGADAADAADAGPHGAVVHLAGRVPEPRLDPRRRRQPPAAPQLVRDAPAPGLEPAAAVVGGLAVDRRRPRVGGGRGVGRREGVPHRPADVRQAARPEDADPVGPGRLIR